MVVNVKTLWGVYRKLLTTQLPSGSLGAVCLTICTFSELQAQCMVSAKSWVMFKPGGLLLMITPKNEDVGGHDNVDAHDDTEKFFEASHPEPKRNDLTNKPPEPPLDNLVRVPGCTICLRNDFKSTQELGRHRRLVHKEKGTSASSLARHKKEDEAKDSREVGAKSAMKFGRRAADKSDSSEVVTRVGIIVGKLIASAHTYADETGITHSSFDKLVARALYREVFGKECDD
jgi:hypothetical protein